MSQITNPTPLEAAQSFIQSLEKQVEFLSADPACVTVRDEIIGKNYRMVTITKEGIKPEEELVSITQEVARFNDLCCEQCGMKLVYEPLTISCSNCKTEYNAIDYLVDRVLRAEAVQR